MVHARYADWHKSSNSDVNGNCVEVGYRGWHKSSRSGGNGNCVEVGAAHGVVGVRDSKQCGAGPILEFTASEWSAFVSAVKDGEYDL